MLLTTSGIVRINKKELKYLPSGSAVLKMSCVSSEKFKKQDGTDGENVSWIDVISYGKQAETINRFFEEKDRIYILGKMKQQTWEKDGQKQSKHTVEIDSFDFIEKKNNQGQSNNQPQQRSEPPIEYEDGYKQSKPNTEYRVPEFDIEEDSIPFN